MKTKKIISVLLAVLMMFSVSSVAFASEDEKITSGQIGDNVFWSFDEETETMTVSGTGGTWVHNTALPYQDSYHPGVETLKVKKLIVEEGITSLACHQFSLMSWLQEAVLPSTLEELGAGCFYFCYSLKGIVLPEKITKILNDTFWNCYSLKTVECLGKIETIGVYAFLGCAELETINLNDSVKAIYQDAFSGCYKLRSITGASAVETIGDAAFINCVSLESFPFNGEVLKEIGTEAFWGCRSLNVTSDSLKAINRIGYGAFVAANVEGINVESNDIVIEDYALGCTYPDEVLKYYELAMEYSILIHQETVSKYNDPEHYQEYHEKWREKADEYISYHSEIIETYRDRSENYRYGEFEPTERTNTIICCERDSKAYEYACYYKLGVRYINNSHPDNACGENAYWEYDENTKTLYILGYGPMWDITQKHHIDPGGRYEFYYDVRGYEKHSLEIERVVIGDEITKIGRESLERLIRVKDIHIGSSVEEIGERAFGSNYSLESIVVPGNVKKIDEYAFCDDINLRNITLEEGIETIGDVAFTSFLVDNITIPSTVKEIGKSSMYIVLEEATVINNSPVAIVKNDLYYDDDTHAYLNKDIAEMYVWYAVNSALWYLDNLNFTEDDIIEMLNEEFATSFSSFNEFDEYLVNNFIEPDGNYPEGFVIECLTDSAQHEFCVAEGINHRIIGSSGDCKCGVHTESVGEDKLPTCTQNGHTGAVTCKECGVILKESSVIPATGHKIITVSAVAPTCTQDGHTEGKICETCGEILSEAQVIPATGHLDTNNDGVCERCGRQFEEVKGNSFIERITAFFQNIIDTFRNLFRNIFG